ncbi:EAL domain-containing protein, partial [Pseudomonas sp. AB12(2023)]|uniref:EAL domain-containing protein n=1 Tax=Pseudomonas sp. AB12(2023) TaxID=3048597 RepID=UPI002B232266
IETWYQPIVDLQNPRVAAAEALARWRRPEIGIVAPGDFIAIAEETGLIRDIGRAETLTLTA